MSETPRPARFGPDRMTLAAVLVLAVCTVPLATSDRRLLWLLLVPVAWAVWVLRARVVVDAEGLQVCQGLTVRRHAWRDVEGFDVGDRGTVTLLTGAGRTRLRPVPRERRTAFLAAAQQASRASR